VLVEPRGDELFFQPRPTPVWARSGRRELILDSLRRGSGVPRRVRWNRTASSSPCCHQLLGQPRQQRGKHFVILASLANRHPKSSRKGNSGSNVPPNAVALNRAQVDSGRFGPSAEKDKRPVPSTCNRQLQSGPPTPLASKERLTHTRPSVEGAASSSTSPLPGVRSPRLCARHHRETQ